MPRPPPLKGIIRLPTYDTGSGARSGRNAGGVAHLPQFQDIQDVTADVTILDAHHLAPLAFPPASGAHVKRPFASGHSVIHYAHYTPPVFARTRASPLAAGTSMAGARACVEPGHAGQCALRVAVKFCLSGDVDSENNEARTEVEFLTRLAGSPNIVGFYGGYWWGNRLGVVMELASHPCRTLDGLLEQLHTASQVTSAHSVSPSSQFESWSKRDLWCVIYGIARGLAHMHQRDIVHRDIKPNNILLCVGANNTIIPKLCDFGSATFASRQESRTTGGVWSFTPPQDPEDMDSRLSALCADVYCFALVLWSTFTLQWPFKEWDSTEFEFHDRIQRGMRPAIPSLFPVIENGRVVQTFQSQALQPPGSPQLHIASSSSPYNLPVSMAVSPVCLKKARTSQSPSSMDLGEDGHSPSREEDFETLLRAECMDAEEGGEVATRMDVGEESGIRKTAVAMDGYSLQERGLSRNMRALLTSLWHGDALQRYPYEGDDTKPLSTHNSGDYLPMDRVIRVLEKMRRTDRTFHPSYEQSPLYA